MTNYTERPAEAKKKPLSYWLDKPGLVEYLMSRQKQTDLSKSIGVSQTTFSQWAVAVNRNYGVNQDSVHSLLRSKGIDPTTCDPFSPAIRHLIELRFNSTVEAQPTPQQPPMPRPLASNITAEVLAGISVPILSKVPAGSLADVGPQYTLGHVQAMSRKVDHRCYGLKVVGDSMTAPSNPSFPDGSLIFVRPCEEAQSGQFVIAQSDDSTDWTFKRLHVDAGQPYLVPLNPRYPLMEMRATGMRVVGVVVGGQLELTVPF